MNNKIVLIAFVLCVKLSADSEEVTEKKSKFWNHYIKRKLLDIYSDTVDCVPGKTRFKGKCLTNEQIKIMKKNENSDDYEDETTTNITPTLDGDDGNKSMTNATNGNDIVSTSSTIESKEVVTNSTTPTLNGDSNDKGQTNLMNKVTTESTEHITTKPTDEHDNKPKTYPTNSINVDHGPKILEGDEVITTSTPNDKVKNYVVAIFIVAVGIYLIFYFWCMYKQCYGRRQSPTN